VETEQIIYISLYSHYSFFSLHRQVCQSRDKKKKKRCTPASTHRQPLARECLLTEKEKLHATSLQSRLVMEEKEKTRENTHSINFIVGALHNNYQSSLPMLACSLSWSVTLVRSGGCRTSPKLTGKGI
jgi:hypothetical protein